MNIINSLSNNKVKLIKSLNKKKNRLEENLFIIEGEKIIFEAIDKKYKLNMIVFSEDYYHENKDSIKKLNKYNLELVSNKVFRDISDTETPQGILALAALDYKHLNKSIDLRDGFFLLVDRVQDPGNMGTILRSADAFGIDGIILNKGTVDIYNPKVIRSTMGAIFRTKVYYLDEINDLKELIEEKSIRLISTSLQGQTDIKSVDLTKGIFVVGNESQGVSKTLEGMSKDLIKIPMIGETESLNVAVASSIIMYESMLQKKAKIL